MKKRDLIVSCPDCGSQLRIDRETGAVLAHGEGSAPKDLDEVQSRMEQRQKKKEDAFGAALQAEKGRKNELDALFKKASDAAAASKDEDPPENPLDERWR